MPHGRSHSVAQAVVVILGHADCSVDDALLLMQEHARINSQTLEEVAVNVVAGLVRLGPRGQLIIDLNAPQRLVSSGDS
jgi:hypothetical protein